MVAGDIGLGKTQASRYARRLLWLIVLVTVTLGTAAGTRVLYQRSWPQVLPVFFPSATPRPVFLNGQLRLESATGVLLGSVGTFSDELRAYLNFEYLRSLREVGVQQVLLTATEMKSGPRYRI